MYLSQNIRFLRKQRKITQEELAKKIGKNPVSISDYEKGRSTPPYETAILLCEIFGISLDDLVRKDLQAESHLKKGGQSANQPDYQTEYEQLQKQLRTQERLTQLQEQRLAELEREIRERAPELARRLGLG